MSDSITSKTVCSRSSFTAGCLFYAINYEVARSEIILVHSAIISNLGMLEIPSIPFPSIFPPSPSLHLSISYLLVIPTTSAIRRAAVHTSKTTIHRLCWPDILAGLNISVAFLIVDCCTFCASDCIQERFSMWRGSTLSEEEKGGNGKLQRNRRCCLSEVESFAGQLR